MKIQNDENDETIKSIERWDDIEVLKEYILRGIYSYGFESPSPIQKAIYQLLKVRILSLKLNLVQGKLVLFLFYICR